ncbi:MOG interacting and ectopic P-granules protein 1 isoform X3 [Folsomia candida]|uniref:MOG interacting and ectopic P-granules protein 1 isoform X3 n=1 Tax=Folsomia candida TaxID=158441 RepID=UPI000B904CC2|nr:MOG interacting and ectopic P-granules protein 1 isoform X3 [Folsomia candida]
MRSNAMDPEVAVVDDDKEQDGVVDEVVMVKKSATGPPVDGDEDDVLLLSDDEENSVNPADVKSSMNGRRGQEGEDEDEEDVVDEEDDDDDDIVEVPDDYDEDVSGDGVLPPAVENGDSFDISDSVTDNDSRSNDLVIKNIQGGRRGGGAVNGELDEDDILLLSDDNSNSVSEEGGRIKNGRKEQQLLQEEDDDDEIMEVDNPDPLFSYEDEGSGSATDVVALPSNSNNNNNNNIKSNKKPMENGEVGEISETEASEEVNVADNSSDAKSNNNTIVVNDTKSLVDLANSKKEPGNEPTLVIIDTNALMAGRGAVPVSKPNLQHHPQHASSNSHHHSSKGSSRNGGSGSSNNASIDIPDDAYLIEAPSFIVPYVFECEQNGDKSLKETIKELANKVKEVRDAKLAKGEELTDLDKLTESKTSSSSDDYFESPVGKLLTNIGMNMVQEFVQCDLLKMQKRQGEKEKAKSRMSMMTHLTQQSIFSLKKNIEESKENNEPFRSKMKKCELCNFRTESELVMSTHQETPHMKNYSYRCNFCTFTTRVPHEIIFHMEAEHAVRARLERAPAYHQCPSCPFEDNSKAKLTRHLLGCVKRYVPAKNLEPPSEWDTPAKLPKLPKNRILPQGINPAFLAPTNQRGSGMAGFNPMLQKQYQSQQQQGGMSMKGNLPPLLHAAPNKHKPIPGLIRTNNPRSIQNPVINPQLQRGMMMRGSGQMQAHNLQMQNHMLQQVGTTTQMRGAVGRPGGSQPSISITPLPSRQGGGGNPSTSSSAAASHKPPSQGQGGAKTSFVICEICDGYIKDLDQLRNHMQWIHKVKIHPKMIYNKPPLNCQKCQFRFFTDQGLERHLLGSHGLVTSSMQDAANKGQDSGRCPLCGKVYQWKLLAHVAKDHNVTLKPAHLSYKCTVCTATFGMYKLFESHVYSAHSVTKNAPRQERRVPQQMQQGKMGGGLQVTPRSMPVNSAQNNSYKPLKINDEITIIPQPMANSALQRNKGSLTITPHQPMRRNVSGRNHEDEGIQIIEIDDAPHKNGVRPNGNRFTMSETLRKRNLEISVCDSENSDDSRGPIKRLRQN